MRPSYDDFVFGEIKRIGRAWYAANPSADTSNLAQMFEKIGEMAWRRLVDDKSERRIYEEIGVNPDEYLPEQPVPPAPTYRLGLVRSDGRAVRDGSGQFAPLGASFFWLFWGWKYDRARTEQNLAALAPYVDYLRVFGEVGGSSWADRVIDPDWPDYEAIVADCVRTVRATYGLRLAITAIAGGTGHNPVPKLIAALRGQDDAIIHFEAANESFKNFPDPAALKRETQALRTAFPDSLVSASWTGDLESVHATLAYANMVTAHLDRNLPTERQIRQSRDFVDIPAVCSQNEPAGPESSVATQERPIDLAAQRAAGLINRMPLYVYHAGPGVRGGGAQDRGLGRHANFFELPNFHEHMRALKAVATLIPADVMNWGWHNGHWPTSPLSPDFIWSDGFPAGVSRIYSAVRGAEFVSIIVRVKEITTISLRQAADVTVYDPSTGGIVLTAGRVQSFQLIGPERGGLDHYLVKGHLV